ncbi:FAD-binding oxidoreductase [Desulfopila aestuarii]|uniref:FAD binding domain-containing protein n=1 Tax=Desulfopila aestuarii DSM 18488 TaxID=1121416 RepID=A0A1M7XY30_9BACT|nr:FAD-binding oxidoreductase [Desulfopila aestuarii]SHO43902.1 FAD binding domain-containing protein [Desulfopila aestuarii DSM 18488]
MFLSPEVYKKFEDIVGEENICGDLAIMPSYHSGQIGAVVLPKDTEQVQAIVKLCNRLNIQFTVMSTGFIRAAMPQGCIYLDMRRMNKIIEINEKDMYAVVEPYVTSAELQAELMKRGLNCSIKGSGAQCTAIIRGHGHMDLSTGGDDRNQLGMEWVTPAGDVLKLGALGSTHEWFCGDGPGPSLRGVISGRGSGDALAEGGVITKAAMKLYHWPGPAAFELEGQSPNYNLKEIPPNFMVRYYSFPSVPQMYEAELKIGESEIMFALMGFNVAMLSANISPNMEMELEVIEKLNKEVQGPGFYVIVAANSPEEFEYDQKVLDKIISDTGGKSLAMVEDPKVGALVLIHGVRISVSIRETFRLRPVGGKAYGFQIMGQRDVNIKWIDEAANRKKELIKKGLGADDGGVYFGWSVENSHLGKTEIFFDPSPHPESLDAIIDWQQTTARKALEDHLNPPTHLPLSVVGPEVSNYHIWSKKLDEAFNPNGTTVVLPSLMG